ncbi:hypothetical protein [Runella slithyformis]|uniref:Uncharacterized protein n=1 Tax=Runella slithyformis (strain ATCC 29530 / DSM 19594 / LMG 11500 / NCIMB 11436 / LSU 4) TaxID=761193 RepID=A0A7U4E614_RUNSL|nr:hypothetical protein [Runella slithyformis]AEI48734.1 hypothetical protein Runsl_2323 [Runella slithyformis DSM 19594]
MRSPFIDFYFERFFSEQFIWKAALWIYLGIYFGYVWTYSLNIPYNDDFTALLGYVVRFKDAPFSEQLKSLLLPHNEHIICATRIVGLVQYTLLGKLNFQWLILSGNLLLVVELSILYGLCKRLAVHSGFYFFLVSIVFINPQYSATTFWAMAVWSNILVLVVGTFTILSLVYEFPLWLSVVLASLSMFSIGSGIMLWPVGFTILWLQGNTRVKLIKWIFCGVAFVLMYFSILASHPTPDTFIVGNLALFPINILAFIGSFGALAGGILGQAMAVLLGFLLLGLTLKIGLDYRKAPNRELLVLISLVLFVFLTACSIAIFRSEKGLDIVVGSRYKQYSSLLMALGLIMVFQLKNITNQYSAAKAIIGGVLVIVTFLSYLRDIGYRLSTRWITTAAYYNTLHNHTDLYSEGPTSEVVKAATKGHQTGVFILPKEYDLSQKILTATQISVNLRSKITYESPEKFYEKAGRYLSVSEPRLAIPLHSTEGIYLVLNYANRYYIVSTSSRRNSLKKMWHDKSYFQQGIEAETIDTMLPKAPFKVAWLEIKHSSTQLFLNP